MQDLAGKHIVLGLTGGIACYKSAELCRLFVKAGATVQVVMTEAAEQFITPVTMQALSGRTVYTSQWDAREPNNMPHINLSREADAIVLAPCSADFIARLVQGRSDDLLSLMCLARPMDRIPLLIAPAMNREMWGHPATQRNLMQVAADGATVKPGFEIKGIAWDSGSGIRTVETSLDGGAHWAPASLGQDLGHYAFRPFSAALKAAPGAVKVMVRATSNAGEVQVDKLKFNPAGYHHNVIQTLALTVA